MLASVLQERRDPAEDPAMGKTMKGQQCVGGRSSDLKNQTKRKQASKKMLLWLQPGTQDSKQRRLESQYILPWGKEMNIKQRAKMKAVYSKHKLPQP